MNKQTYEGIENQLNKNRTDEKQTEQLSDKQDKQTD